MFDPLMWAAAIVVKILVKDVVEVSLIENNKPVKTFFADTTDPALGKRVGFRCAYRCFDDIDPFDFEDVYVLASAIADQAAGWIT